MISYNKKALRRILKEKGMSEKDFAQELANNVKYQAPTQRVSAWVAGVGGKPNIVTLILWCNILGVMPNDFFDVKS